MRKQTLILFAMATIAITSCTKETSTPDEIVVTGAQKELLNGQQINAVIKQSLTVKGSFAWEEASSQIVWSAIELGNKICTVGFGDSRADFDRSKSSRSRDLQQQIYSILERYEGKPMDKMLINSDPYLNLVDVLIEKQETVIALRNSKLVRYVEPADYKFFANEPNTQKSSVTSSGCGFDAETLATEDFTTIAPNAKAPWSFYKHNIPSAWEYSTGRGITIGIVDTGASPNQSLLNANFNNGYSTGRTVQRFGVYVDSVWPWSTGTDGPDDQCGHGTSMSSVAAAPRNDKGLPVGVAYNANLIVYRAASNVVLDGYHEQNGVKNTFTALANNTNVKIISMSMGHIFSVGKIEDGVRYAYSKGKLIFCAGGTSTSFTTFVGVIFPAWMSETVAVTGVKEGTGYTACDVCHTGDKIEFTVAMQRAASGNSVPVNSYYDGLTDYVGGSSVATATTAGIAALVWAKNPSWTRDQVLNKMRQSGNLYPNRSSTYGYGNVDALRAVQ